MKGRSGFAPIGSGKPTARGGALCQDDALPGLFQNGLAATILGVAEGDQSCLTA
jgi:hypothetical protein